MNSDIKKKVCSNCIANAHSSSEVGTAWILAPWEDCEQCHPKPNLIDDSNAPILVSKEKISYSFCSPVTYIDPKQGTKHDNGKAPLSILTRESLEAEARAFEYGARKYDKNNYKKGMNWSRVIDAALRHLTAFNAKEDFDKESLLNHLWHAKACLAMLIYYYENKKGVDDR